MKRSLVRMISLLIALFGICLAVRDAGALDAPHNTNDNTWSITCSKCHYSPSSVPSWATAPTATDNTFVNNLCKYCHSDNKMGSSSPEYRYAQTHSSYQTSTQYNGGVPWTFDCSVCHHPHFQQQATIYGTDQLNTVATGSITSIVSSPSVSTSTMTDNNKNFIGIAQGLSLSPADLAGYLLIPNINYPNRIYRIASTQTTTLTVDGAINTNYAGVGSTYAIRFSKMIRDQIQTPKGGARTVKMFNDQGLMSFGTGTMAVCQVCHTETHSYLSNGFGSSGQHSTGDADEEPQGRCSKCHDHRYGFKPPQASCNVCHGNPPTLNVLGPGGLVGTSPTTTNLPTGATSPINVGAHPRHSSTIGMRCETCHYATPMPNFDGKIRMGFMVNSGNFYGTSFVNTVTSGTIAVRGALVNGYTWTATTAGTQLVSVSTYSYTCSAVYCHGGGTQTLVSLAGGSDTTPNWIGGPNQAVCGSCHGVSKATYTSPGSHNRHVNTGTEQMGLACTNCHGSITDYTHVNGEARWNLNLGNALIGPAATYRGAASGGSGTLAPSKTYGQCGNMYCHGSVQANDGTGAPSYYDLPTWGASTVSCGTCHGQGNATTGEPATANHARHASTSTGYGYSCAVCHTNGGDNTAQHSNGLIETGISSTWGNSPQYSQGTASAPRNGFGSCTATYCHSRGTSATTLVASLVTATWGNSLNCAGCHGGNVITTPTMTTMAHAQHVNATSEVGKYILCAECHKATVASGDAPISTASYHVNKLVNIKFDNVLNRDSENPLYNNLTTTLATGATKTPGLGGYACANLYCHSIGNLSGTNPNTNTLVTAGGVSYRTVLWNTTGVGCFSCHGDTTSRSHPVYSGLGSQGTSTANSHQKHVESYNYSCDYCHITTTDDPKTAPTYVSNGGAHLNRVEDVSFKLYNGFTGTYSFTTKVCMTTYCHGSSGQPVWGQIGPLACDACHGNPPLTGAHTLHVGGLTATVYGNAENFSLSNEYRFNCGNCHPGNASAFHYNGQVDISMASTDPGAGGTLKALNSTAPTFTYSGSKINGVCGNIYCHSYGLKIGVPNSNIMSSAVSPSWNATVTGNKCGKCHGNPPQYASAGAGVPGANSHYNATGFMGQEGGHLVGQHFDNIFNNSAGLMSAGPTNTSSHGNSTTSTTISCLTCHNTVVSSTTIDTYAMDSTGSAMRCGACHTGSSPTKLQAGAISNRQLHVNGNAEVAFISPMRSRSQLRNTPTPTWTRVGVYKTAGSYDTAALNDIDWVPGTRTCVTACHNSEPVTWGDPNVTCYSCHKGL